MYKYVVFSILLLSTPFIGAGQQKVTLFLSSDWEITNEKNHSYYRVCHYNLNDLTLDGIVEDYNKENVLLMSGFYSNGKKQGEFHFFYDNGNEKARGSFDNDSEIGEWIYFYINGSIKQKVLFMKGERPEFKLSEYFNESGNQLLKDGTGSWESEPTRGGLFDSESLKVIRGEYKNYKLHGNWIMTRLSDGKIMISEKFKNGDFISCKVYNSFMDYEGTVSKPQILKKPSPYAYKFSKTENFILDEEAFSDELLYADAETIFKTITGLHYTIKNRPAGYKYGDYALLEFIAINIKYPLDAIKKNMTGKVYVKVIISPNGEAKDISVLKGTNHKLLDEEALRVIGMITEWLPEIKEGIEVESQITIPVRFNL